jgi:superfamily II DNA or RNA helicase
MGELLRKSDEGVLVAPAGSGKTVMGLSLIPVLGQPTLWLTHTGPLATQAKERAEYFLPSVGEIGRIGGGKWNEGEILTIAMVQTLVRNPDKLVQMRNNFGLVVLDEAHHCPARTFLEVVCMLNPRYLYGLTATPYRRDKLENLMFQVLGTTKTVIPIGAVKDHGGVIVPLIKVCSFPSAVVDDNNIQRILKNHIVYNNKRNHTIVNDVIREAQAGNYCIVISDRREHCEMLYKMIKSRWSKTGVATGKYSRKYIRRQVEEFDSGEITVLVATFSLLGEGFDVPFLNRAFICMPFRAEAKAEQLIGRIQRSHPDKKDAVVYDYLDVNIGVLKNQFKSSRGSCRYRAYTRVGAEIESC